MTNHPQSYLIDSDLLKNCSTNRGWHSMHSVKTSVSWRYWLPSIHCFVFLGHILVYLLVIFYIPKFFFSNNIFSLLAPLVYSIVFFLCLIINFFLSFLSTTLHELVANSILWLPRVLYFSSFFFWWHQQVKPFHFCF